jgi:TRAP-type uncharacterized transport system substrate-binding protein
MRFVDEMASVLNDGDNLRILPIVSYGAASNLDDLLYLRGVDAAVTQSDVFEYFRTQRKTPNLERRVQYVIRMPISELHILARNDVQSLEDLRGKKVNFGPAGTGASLTGTIVPPHAQDIYREAFNHAFAAHAGEDRQEEAAHRIV